MDACWAPTYLSDGTNDKTQAVKIAPSLRWMQTMSVLSIALLLILMGSFRWWTQVEVGLHNSCESEVLFLDVTPLLLQRHFQRTCRIYAKQAKLPSNDAAAGETPLSSPERQATTAMPLRISRTPLQLGTIPSGNFHPHAYIPVHITIPISHPPTSPIPSTPCLFLLYHSPSSFVQSTDSSLPSSPTCMKTTVHDNLHSYYPSHPLSTTHTRPASSCPFINPYAHATWTTLGHRNLSSENPPCFILVISPIRKGHGASEHHPSPSHSSPVLLLMFRPLGTTPIISVVGWTGAGTILLDIRMQKVKMIAMMDDDFLDIKEAEWREHHSTSAWLASDFITRLHLVFLGLSMRLRRHQLLPIAGLGLYSVLAFFYAGFLCATSI